MSAGADNPGVLIHPPIALAIAILAGFALRWLAPLPFLPAGIAASWLGGTLFALALALGIWAVATMVRAGTNVPTHRPALAVVATGPYRLTRNPIYLGMMLIIIALAIGFNDLWLLVVLAPFALVIRYGVVAREEAYLERKFGEAYRAYCARVRRWL